MQDHHARVSNSIVAKAKRAAEKKTLDMNDFRLRSAKAWRTINRRMKATRQAEAATTIASMARYRAAQRQVLRLKCKNNLDLHLNPLTPGQPTFRLQQGQCLTLKDAIMLWLRAQNNNHLTPINPYNNNHLTPIERDKLHKWIMQMIVKAASRPSSAAQTPLNLINQWLNDTTQELIESPRPGSEDELQAMIDLSNDMPQPWQFMPPFTLTPELAEPLIQEALYYINRWGVVDVIQEFWKENLE